MIISDLNYLENTSEEIIGGLGGTFTVAKNVGAVVNLAYTQSTNVSANVSGNTAGVTGTANATGNNTYTNVLGGTSTTSGSSSSFLEAVSVTSR
jgi:N-methylhydantoinase A/oxoprolinase/acetone carboxylase beta subunit